MNEDTRTRVLLAALAAVGAYAVAATLDMGWLGYAVPISAALGLALLVAREDLLDYRRDRDSRGVTYAGFGDLPEVERTDVFDVPELVDPWIEPEVWRAAQAGPRRAPDWPLPVEAEAVVATQDARRDTGSGAFDDLLARWDADLDETFRRWDRELRELGVPSC